MHIDLELDLELDLESDIDIDFVKSNIKSSIFSIPTDNRIRSSGNPLLSAGIDACDIFDGILMRLVNDPKLTDILKIRVLFTMSIDLSTSPVSNETTAPAPDACSKWAT